MKLLIGLKAIFLVLVFNTAAMATPVTITWEELIPAEGLGAKIKINEAETPIGTPGIAEFDGNEEEFEAFKEDIAFMKQLQPEGGLINAQLHGQSIKIAGYVTPVGFDGDQVTEFLFVPYMGACIHVPPPAANQIVYVKNAKGLTAAQMYEPIWLTGTMQAKPVSTILADVGYSIDGATVEAYLEDDIVTDNAFTE
ncbi:MAG: DUF3299 domain-containing protein [Pseudomonadota bacterium]